MRWDTNRNRNYRLLTEVKYLKPKLGSRVHYYISTKIQGALVVWGQEGVVYDDNDILVVVMNQSRNFYQRLFLAEI